MNDILSIYYKCSLSALTHKLNASGHKFIWTVFFKYVELVPRVCPQLSVTPGTDDNSLLRTVISIQLHAACRNLRDGRPNYRTIV
jgi:hypothetical protein